LIDWCSSPVDTTTSHTCFTGCIGCVRRSEWRTSMPYWCTSVAENSRRPTWLTIYSLPLNFRVDNVFVHHRPRHWLYHRHAFVPSATDLFPSQQQNVEQSAAGSGVIANIVILQIQTENSFVFSFIFSRTGSKVT